MSNATNNKTCVIYRPRNDADPYKPYGWSIQEKDFVEFLSLPSDTVVIGPPREGDQVYHKSDLSVVDVMKGSRCIGQLYLSEDGKYVFYPDANTQQVVWEALYPCAAQRGMAKIEVLLLSRYAHTISHDWYFYGEASLRLYRVNSDGRITLANTDAQISRYAHNYTRGGLYSIGLSDGFPEDCFDHDRQFFDIRALQYVKLGDTKTDTVDSVLERVEFRNKEFVALLRRVLTYQEYYAVTDEYVRKNKYYCTSARTIEVESGC